MRNIDDVEVFFETTRDKYPKLMKNARAHICPDENIMINLIESKDDEPLRTVYIDSLDHEELLTITECDGSKTTSEILGSVENKYRDNEIKIKSMIELLKSYNNLFLEFEDTPTDIPDVLEITGTVEYFIPIYMVIEIGVGRYDKYNTKIMLKALEIISSNGCRFIEIKGKDVIGNRNLNEVFKYIINNFELVIMRIENLKLDRSITKEFDNNKEKILWVVNKEDNMEIELKEQITIANLTKKGNTVRVAKSGNPLDLNDINIQYVSESFRENRYKYDKIYIYSDGRVEIKKIYEKGRELGKLENLVIEDILLTRYDSLNIDRRVLKNI